MKTMNYKLNRNLLIFGVMTSLFFFALPLRAQDVPEDTPPDAPSVPPVDDDSSGDLRIPPEYNSGEDDEAAEPPTEMAQEAAPEEMPPARLQGELPTRIRKVSISGADNTIAESLQSVAKQAGIGIVMDPSLGSLQKKMTISLNRKPFTEVLEIILEAGDLQATLKGDILFVTAGLEDESEDEDDESSFDVRLSADTDSSGAVINITTNKSRKKRGKKYRTYHEKNRVQVGKSVHVKAGEEVDDAIAIGGELTVEGTVRGDAVSVGGALTIEPTAHIHGDAVAVGGPLEIKEGAVIEGEQVGVGIPFPIGSILKASEDGEIDVALPSVLSGIFGTLAAVSFLGVLLRSVLLFVLALAITALAPKRVERIRDYLANSTGYSILAGLVILLAFIPLIVLLAITLIGIPLIPLVIIALLILMVFGLAAFLSWVGYKIPIFKSRKSQLAAMAIGAVTIMIVNLIPVAGPFFLFLVSFVSAGAALLSRLGSESKA